MGVARSEGFEYNPLKSKVGKFEEIETRPTTDFFTLNNTRNRSLKMSKSSVMKIKRVNAVKVSTNSCTCC